VLSYLTTEAQFDFQKMPEQHAQAIARETKSFGQATNYEVVGT
jgi:hypothetical protein